eukprot:5057328-Prymnesium_polylepis.1
MLPSKCADGTAQTRAAQHAHSAHRACAFLLFDRRCIPPQGPTSGGRTGASCRCGAGLMRRGDWQHNAAADRLAPGRPARRRSSERADLDLDQASCGRRGHKV